MLLLLFLQISFLQIHVCLLLVQGRIPPEAEPEARIQVQPVCLGGDLREQERGQWGNETGMRVEGSQHKGVRGDCWGVWGSIFQGTTHLSDVPERWIFSTISQLTLFEGCSHGHLLPDTWPALPGPSTLLWPRVADACRNKTMELWSDKDGVFCIPDVISQAHTSTEAAFRSTVHLPWYLVSSMGRQTCAKFPWTLLVPLLHKPLLEAKAN